MQGHRPTARPAEAKLISKELFAGLEADGQKN
jgi:hypothetical protein